MSFKISLLLIHFKNYFICDIMLQGGEDMKIAILYGKYGMGHYSAALAIKEQLEKQLHDVEFILQDFIAYAYPWVNKILYSSFDILTKKTPKFYSQAYNIVANKDDNVLNAQYMLAQFIRYNKEYKPDIVISTLPAISKTVSTFKDKYHSNLPLVTCVTDITNFYEWVAHQSDLYMVPSLSVQKFLIQHGIKKEKILITGIPVKQKFHQLTKEQHDKKHLLIMGGGVGVIPLDTQFYEEMSKENIQIDVMCAKNKELYQQLLGKYPNITPHTFNDKIEQFMAKADLVITKTGGISTFECIYAKLPIITYIPFIAQEKLNAAFIEEQKIGKIMWENDKNPAKLIKQLLISNEITTMQQNMAFLRSKFNTTYPDKIMELLRKVQYAKSS